MFDRKSIYSYFLFGPQKYLSLHHCALMLKPYQLYILHLRHETQAQHQFYAKVCVLGHLLS